jgi:PhzF family phenazine biosynthesis protein
MPITIYQIDSFASEPFKGNPAAVCLMDKLADERWMQNFAAEMNLAETCYVVPDGDAFAIRWFTPVLEVDLCGHATLASAHALWEEGVVPHDRDIKFMSRSGLLTVSRRDDWIELDFPEWPYQSISLDPRLAEAIGEEPLDVVQSKGMCLVELVSEDVVRNLSPNLEIINLLPFDDVVVTSKGSTGDYDFVSRCFCPKVGIDEDPVTGSIHCCLGPYWKAKMGKDEFVAYQASTRGGVLRVKVAGDRIKIAGQAVTIFRGELK